MFKGEIVNTIQILIRKYSKNAESKKRKRVIYLLKNWFRLFANYKIIYFKNKFIDIVKNDENLGFFECN